MSRFYQQLLAALSACFLCAIGGASAQAQQVTLSPIKDNTLYQDDLGSLSNSAGQHMFVGTTASGLRRRAVVAFDIAGNIPAGSTIQDAVLSLNMSMAAVDNPIDIDLSAALSDWGEGTSVAPGNEGGGGPSTPGDATWIHTFFDTEFWSAPGGDFNAVASATTSVGAVGTYAWTGSGVAADIQKWLDQPSTNFGWGLIATNFEDTPSTAKRFDAREVTDPTLAPSLSVTYIPPQTTTVVIPALKDNTLYEEDFGALSNGAGQHMFVGTTNRGLLRRALVAFDVAGNVPAGSTVQGAVLTLNLSRGAGIAIDIDLRAARQDWGEGTSVADGEEGGGAPATSGDATWIHTFFDTQTWTFQGGDFVATPSATTTVDALGSYSWNGPGLVADVQQWLDQPATNFGWGLIATNFEHTYMAVRRFDTKENSDPALQPSLTVTYMPPSP